MQIILSAYNAQPSGTSGLFSIRMNIGGTEPDPLPRKRLDVKNAAAAIEAFDAYIAEVKATGKLAAVTVRAEGRKAPGFDKAVAGYPSYVIVNDEVTA